MTFIHYKPNVIVILESIVIGSVGEKEFFWEGIILYPVVFELSEDAGGVSH